MADNQDTMTVEQYRKYLETSARETSADVRQIKGETRDTGRDVQDIKDDVAGIRDQLSSIQANQKTQRRAPSPKRPVFNTRRGANTLTGVSLNEIALRIKSQNPQMNYTDALKAAKPVKNQNDKDAEAHKKQLKELGKAQDTLNTGGGSVIGNLKRSLLRSTLGENLGTKASRFLTSKTTQEKAAQTILNFDSDKAKRVQEVQPVEALGQQVQQLAAAVKNNTAVKVEAPKEVKPIVKEDLSDTVAALKILGYQMKEIKEKLSTLPRGLSTEDQIKHALKSSSERIAARDAHREVAAAIKAHEPAPVVAPAPTPTIEPKKPDNVKLSTAPPVKAVRGAIPADQLSTRKKEEAQTTADAQKAEQEGSWKVAVTKKLYAIQDSIGKIHSESFIGLLVVGLLAALKPFWKPIVDTINTVWTVVKTIFTKIEEFSDWATTKILDLWEHLTPSGRTMNKAGGLAGAVGHAIGKGVAELSGEDQSTIDEIDSDYAKDSKKRKNKEKLYSGQNVNGVKYDDGMIDSMSKSAEDAKRLQRKYWVDDQYELHPLIQRSEPKGVTPDRASQMEKHTDEKAKLQSDKAASMIIMPTQHTIKTVPIPTSGGGGGDNGALAILAARNSEDSSQNYIGSIFNHPATYGPIGRV